jgi:hypothetical protein
LKPLWSLNFLIQALQSHMAKFNQTEMNIELRN